MQILSSIHHTSTVVSRKYALPLQLSLSTKRKGGLYAGCDNFSRDYSLLSDKASPHCHCWWGVEVKREAERCSQH